MGGLRRGILIGVFITALFTVIGYQVSSYRGTVFKCFAVANENGFRSFRAQDIKVNYTDESYDSWVAFDTMDVNHVGAAYNGTPLFILSWNQSLFKRPVQSVSVKGLSEINVLEISGSCRK